MTLAETKLARAPGRADGRPGRHRRRGAAAGQPVELGKEMFKVASEGYRVVRRLERPTNRDPAQLLCRPADCGSLRRSSTGRGKFTRLVVDFGGEAVGLTEASGPDWRLLAYSVEKLFSLNSARATGKIDLSDRSRIDDHSPAKGSSTPKKEVFITVDEFFNRIGRLQASAQRSLTAVASARVR